MSTVDPRTLAAARRRLTPRQQRALKLRLDGATYRAIARRMRSAKRLALVDGIPISDQVLVFLRSASKS